MSKQFIKVTVKDEEDFIRPHDIKRIIIKKNKTKGQLLTHETTYTLDNSTLYEIIKEIEEDNNEEA